MECSFCKNTFRTKYLLTNHQKNAKYCLLLQETQSAIIVSDLLTCEYCNKQFGPTNLSRHLNTCKIRDKKLIDEKSELIQLKADNITLKAENIEFKKEIIELKSSLTELKTENTIYKELAKHNQSTVEEIAKQTKQHIHTTNTTQTNVYNNMKPLDINKENFFKIIQESYNKDYFLDGQKGVAKFVVEKLLKDEDGKLMYVCTDPSRSIYRFKGQDGSIEKDVKAYKLTNCLLENVTKKCHSIADTEIEKDKTMFVSYSETYMDIADMINDNSPYLAALSTLTSV